uniref:Chromosome 19 open reading frame 47 n=1 Tax=Salvator merianae TaxID=96440 RepID=A0A8D0BC00_SALMN
MASVTMATSEWIQFFKEAGIPPGPAVNYAVMFVDNRIQKNMLMDLNKEIMNELGITVVGDIIAILKHAKVVYRQEMCKAAAESVASSQTTMQSELRRNANSAATRMIANSLSRDSPPSTPVRRPDTSASKISVTVSNKMAAKNAKGAALCSVGTENSTVPVKRRRVTAEMEGKYIVHMPKGTTAKTKKILEQQAAKGLQRTSVFDRLGAEISADTTTGNKPTGVFSRLGDMQEAEEEKAAESDDDNDDSSVLQYAGVLKKFFKPSVPTERARAGAPIKAKATSSEPQAKAATRVTSPAQHLGSKPPAGASVKEKKAEVPLQGTLTKRLGRHSLSPAEAQDSRVSSSRNKPESEFRVTIKRTLGNSKVFALS